MPVDVPTVCGLQNGYTSVAAYNALSSAYFFPNIFVPLVAGAIAHLIGTSRTMLVFSSASAIGNVMVAMSATPAALNVLGASPFVLLLLGRLFMGIAYEALDVLPIGLLAPLFKDRCLKRSSNRPYLKDITLACGSHHAIRLRFGVTSHVCASGVDGPWSLDSSTERIALVQCSTLWSHRLCSPGTGCKPRSTCRASLAHAYSSRAASTISSPARLRVLRYTH